jgi:hypothetical protein
MYSKFGNVDSLAHKSSQLVLSTPDVKLVFYTKTTKNFQTLDKLKLDFKDTPESLYSDFREFSSLDDVVEMLLLQRKSWERTTNPFKESFINLAWVGSDTSMVPIKFSTLVVDEEPVKFYMKDIYEQNRPEIVDMYEEKMSKLRGVGIPKEVIDRYSKSALVNRLILSRSQVGTRLTKLTRVAGDKISLYNMMRSYGSLPGKGKISDKMIPKSFEFETDGDININDFFDDTFKGDGRWVVKPVYGSRGIGMRITTQEDIRENFVGWASELYGSKRVLFTSWMFSKFIKSFSWKLKNPTPDSLRLCDPKEKTPMKSKKEKVVYKTGLWNVDRVPKLMGDLHDLGESDKSSITITGKEIHNFAITNPSYRMGTSGETTRSKEFKQFRDHTFDDKHGRINKGRVWICCNINDGKYELFVYKKLLFELCSMEFDPTNTKHYNEIQRTWTDANSHLYGQKDNVPEELRSKVVTKFGLDAVNEGRAADLDLCYMVDWEDGGWYQNKKKQIFPVDWSKVKQNLTNMFDVFFQASKDGVNCLSAPNKDVQTKGCFQHFGIDFIVDDNQNTWLLEFNTRPWSGYGFWWRNNFDPFNHHMPHKYIYVESLLRKFVDTKFNKRAEILPLQDVDGIDDLWECVKYDTHYNIKGQKIAVLSNILPSRSNSNWVMTRQMKKVFRDRGWGLFPFGGLVGKPGLTMQGMTHYLKYLTSNYDKKTFQGKMEKMYPSLVASEVVNRIFPLIVYLGDKAKLVEILKNAYPRPISSNLGWDNIVPFTENFRRESKNLMNELSTKLGGGKTWIVKPSLGKQGTGIIISDNPEAIYRHIQDDPDKNEVWSISHYVASPFVTKKRKTHIRTFVLVNNNKGKIGVYQMDPHLIFMAGIPYSDGDAAAFASDFIKPRIISLVEHNNTKCVKTFSDYRNLTNLSQGSYMLNNWIKPDVECDILRKKYPKGSIEHRICDKKNDKELLGYEILSGDASKIVDVEKGKGFYHSTITPQINQIVRQTIEAIGGELRCVNKNKCFQYIAFDFMIEDKPGQPKVWLLEVNVNPGLKAPTKIITDGGMSRFMNSIFDYVLEDKPMIYDSPRVRESWEKDGTHCVLDTSEWKRVNHKKGDLKFYRYSTTVGGRRYDDNGRDMKIISTVAFNKGDKMFEPKKSYMVPQNMRSMSQSELEKNKTKMTMYHGNLFSELFTLDNSTNQKSEDLVRNNYIIDKMGTQQNRNWIQNLLSRMEGPRKENGTQLLTFEAKQMGLPFHDPTFLRNLMNGNMRGLGLPPNADASNIIDYIIRLKEWDNMQEIGKGINDAITGAGYNLLLPIDRSGHNVLSQTAGVGLGQMGMYYQNRGMGFPLLSPKLMATVKRNSQIDHNPVCNTYNVDEMKAILARYGIKLTSKSNRQEVCSVFAFYVGSGYLQLEFPWANQMMLSGFPGAPLGMNQNPVASMLIGMLGDNILGPVALDHLNRLILAENPQELAAAAAVNEAAAAEAAAAVPAADAKFGYRRMSAYGRRF